MREEALTVRTLTAMAAIAIAAALLCIAPARADIAGNVTLVIENDAGMVTQVVDMTRRECDAAAGLLNSRKDNSWVTMACCNAITLGPTPTKAATSRLTSAKCVLQTQDKTGDKP
jgi:hypothetical protein